VFPANCPSFTARTQIAGDIIERSDHDFRDGFGKLEHARFAGGTKAAPVERLDLAGRGEGRARPIRLENKGGSGRFAAVSTMARAYHDRLAAHGETHGTTEAAAAAHADYLLIGICTDVTHQASPYQVAPQSHGRRSRPIS
jgi:hypothetical protein